MADPFVAEIRIFAFSFAPKGWAKCNGQLMPISQNTALFSLLGTYYGGDGKTTFALPNLQGNVPVAWGLGAGLSERFLGENGGTDAVTLLQSEIPVHNHVVMAQGSIGSSNDPEGKLLARPFGGGAMYKAAGSPIGLAAEAFAPVGESVPHNNLQPYLVLNYCIALQGVFPPRG